MAYPRFKFEIAGYSDQDMMWFEPGPSECGYITDGVCFGHDDSAGYVMDFSDLQKCYFAALETRRRIEDGDDTEKESPEEE